MTRMLASTIRSATGGAGAAGGGGGAGGAVGVVEDAADVGVGHQVRDVLGGGGGGGDDADDLLGLGHALGELVYMLDDYVTDGAPDLVGVRVEDVVDDEAPLGQDGARRDGAPQVAGARSGERCSGNAE